MLSQRAWDAQWGEQDHRWELDRGLVSECLQAMDLRDFMVSEVLCSGVRWITLLRIPELILHRVLS